MPEEICGYSCKDMEMFAVRNKVQEEKKGRQVDPPHYLEGDGMDSADPKYPDGKIRKGHPPAGSSRKVALGRIDKTEGIGPQQRHHQGKNETQYQISGKMVAYLAWSQDESPEKSHQEPHNNRAYQDILRQQVKAKERIAEKRKIKSRKNALHDELYFARQQHEEPEYDQDVHDAGIGIICIGDPKLGELENALFHHYPESSPWLIKPVLTVAQSQEPDEIRTPVSKISKRRDNGNRNN